MVIPETRVVFKSKHGEGDPTKTVVIYCSAHDVQDTTEDFLRHGLELSSFDRITVPGGPEFILAARHFPKAGWAGNYWLKFLVQGHQLERVVCISHAGCAWYKNIVSHFLGSHQSPEHQISDLREIRTALREILPGVEIQLFFERQSEFLEVD